MQAIARDSWEWRRIVLEAKVHNKQLCLRRTRRRRPVVGYSDMYSWMLLVSPKQYKAVVIDKGVVFKWKQPSSFRFLNIKIYCQLSISLEALESVSLYALKLSEHIETVQKNVYIFCWPVY